VKVGVCIKQVPPPEARIQVSSPSKGVDGSVFSNMRTNPFDEFGLEEAVSLKEAGVATEVIIITLGNSSSDKMIRSALAKGADRAIRVDDSETNNADCLGVAKAIAAVVRQEEMKIIFCGKQAVDGDNGQVPSMVAELLNWSQVSVISKLEIDGEDFKAHRDIGGGNKAIISGTIPVVFSCDKGLNKPRHANLKTKMAAKKKKLDVMTLGDLGLSSDVVNKSYVVESNWGLPEKNQECKFIDGTDVNAAVGELINLLKKEAKVL